MTEAPNDRQLQRLNAVRGKDMKDIHDCTVCGKDLDPGRKHTDTCGERCFGVLCDWQRRGLA